MSANVKTVGRSIGLILVIVLKTLWVASMIITPLVGMWLSSSLAAYHNSSVLMCVGFGLLLFPILPIAWDRFYLWRSNRKQLERKRVLTGTDRLVLRTLALNLAFIAGVLWVAPSQAFRAISTRGDWVFDGHDGPISSAARSLLFGMADTLEGRWQKTSSVYGKSDKTPDAPSPPKKPDEETGKAQEIKDDVPPKLATAHWPLKSDIHVAVREMPEQVQGSYQEVANYIERRFDDPFERTRALHDYIILRLTYDYETLAKIEANDYSDIRSQQAEAVFAARTGVCEGYARLMRAMGEEAGLDVAYIVGDARFIMRDTEGVGHAWNAVQIDGHWYLMDVTWDDGTMEKHSYTYRTTYLNTPPELFGVDHFPDDESWQLREDPLTIGEFMRQPDLGPDFSLFEFEMLDPTRSQVTVTGDLHMTIGNPRGAYMLARWKPKMSDEKGERCNVRGGDPIKITCELPKEGEYLVVLFGNDEEYGEFGEVAKQLVNRR